MRWQRVRLPHSAVLVGAMPADKSSTQITRQYNRWSWNGCVEYSSGNLCSTYIFHFSRCVIAEDLDYHPGEQGSSTPRGPALPYKPTHALDVGDIRPFQRIGDFSLLLLVSLCLCFSWFHFASDHDFIQARVLTLVSNVSKICAVGTQLILYAYNTLVLQHLDRQGKYWAYFFYYMTLVTLLFPPLFVKVTNL